MSNILSRMVASFRAARMTSPVLIPSSPIAANKAFRECVDWVLAKEGGYVDHPRDNGGATNFGITLRTLAAYRGRAVTKGDVRNMTVEEARAIYLALYWNPVRGDELPRGVDLCVFDAAVHSGPGNSARWLQQALGTVVVDGAIGPRTLAALRANQVSLNVFIMGLIDQRRVFLRGHEDWDVFGRGWTNRLNELEDAATARLIRN